jgi:hypothetical protein
VTDDRQDFVPIEPTPVVAQPTAPPAQPAAAVPPPPPGYYNPTPPPAPAYNPAQDSAQPYPGQTAPAAYPGQQYSGQTVPGSYPGQYAYAPSPPRGLSIASMVLGIVSVVFSVYGIGLFPAIAAVITGHIGRKRQPQGRGFSLAGLITGYIGIGFAVLWIIGIIVFVIIGANGSFDDSSSFGN